MMVREFRLGGESFFANFDDCIIFGKNKTLGFEQSKRLNTYPKRMPFIIMMTS
ncbi:hypothetical protein [Sutcliffiella sp. FSL R7-0096]|uniref:hypothetical protein n=1 Tax=Sutcliffiella sp. FSL R7-0096 TaxID=2921670 RepID=UPI00315A4C38